MRSSGNTSGPFNWRSLSRPANFSESLQFDNRSVDLWNVIDGIWQTEQILS